MSSTKTARASERLWQRTKIAANQEKLKKEVNTVRKLKARLKRTFKAFILAFERCERLNKTTTEMIEQYGKKDAFTPNGKKKGEA